MESRITNQNWPITAVQIKSKLLAGFYLAVLLLITIFVYSVSEVHAAAKSCTPSPSASADGDDNSCKQLALEPPNQKKLCNLTVEVPNTEKTVFKLVETWWDFESGGEMCRYQVITERKVGTFSPWLPTWPCRVSIETETNSYDSVEDCDDVTLDEEQANNLLNGIEEGNFERHFVDHHGRLRIEFNADDVEFQVDWSGPGEVSYRVTSLTLYSGVRTRWYCTCPGAITD